MLVLFLGSTPVSAASSFTDVPANAYYTSAVDWAVKNNVTAGTARSTFSPARGCTRAQIVTFLYRALGEPDAAGGTDHFHDVRAGSYYETAVRWALNAGVTSGTDSAHFSPDKVCTRGQAVTFLMNAMRSTMGEEALSNPFSDVKEGRFYYHPVLWAKFYGVTSGTSAAAFSPGKTCTRAQIVTMLYKAVSWSDQNAHKVTATIDRAVIVDGEDGKDVEIQAAVTGEMEKTTSLALFAVEPYETSLNGKNALASVTNPDSDLEFRVPLMRDSANSLLQKKFYIAETAGESPTIVSNASYIENPEAAADRTDPYPEPARGTKKGLKMQTRDEDIEEAVKLNVSHVAIDVEIGQLLKGTGLKYTYEGQTYEFSDSILVNQQVFKKYNDHGIKVMVVVYMTVNTPREYILPSAVAGSRYGKATIYAWNTADSNCKKLEALMACLTDYWTSGGAHVADWVFSNEIDHYYVYHYSGDISYEEYVRNLADNYRMFNASIKSRFANARCYLSFDHNWNLGYELTGWYRGMKLLDSIRDALQKEGMIHFDVSLHPYPVPEQWPKIWERMGSVTDSGDSPQYSPLNAGSVAAYIKERYGSDVHIIMSETGITSRHRESGTVTNLENEQAAAIILSYYLAEFNDAIDSITIHREMDQPGETAAGWYLGLFRSSYGDPKPSADAFAYMDTKDFETHTSAFLPLVQIGGKGIAAWGDAVPGFDPNRFA